METASISEQLREFVRENYLFGQQQALNDSDSFLELGIIDSTGVLELVAFLEKTYGIQVENEELVPDNLDSIQNVTTYVCRKLSSIARHGTTGLEREYL